MAEGAGEIQESWSGSFETVNYFICIIPPCCIESITANLITLS